MSKEKEKEKEAPAKLERKIDEMTKAIARAQQGEKEALDKAEAKMDEMTKAIARAEQREKEALDKAAETETKIDRMNALITKERACNGEDHRELVKVTTLLMHQITSILRAVEP